MAPSGKGTLMTLDELPVHIGFDHPPVRVVIEGCRAAFPVIIESPVSMPAQRLSQDRPALGLTEDAAVLFGARVKQPHPGTLEIIIAIAGLHQFQPVGRIQFLMGGFQNDLRLFRRRASADDRPALRIQPHGGFPVLLAPDDISRIPESADEAIALKAQIVQDLQQLRCGFLQILHILRLILAELLHDVQRIIQLERHKRALSLGTQHQTVVPVRMQACRHPMRSQMGHAEIDRPLQMLPHRARILVCKGDNFIEVSHVPGLGNILVHRREQPQRIVRPVARMPCRLDITLLFRCVLMPRIMSILHQRQSGTMMHLCAQHEGQHLPSHLRIQMHDALDVLYGIPVSVSIPFPAVDQARRPAPHERGKALERIPGVDHRVKVLIRRGNLQIGQFPVPVGNQLLQFLFNRRGCIRIMVHDLLRLKDRLLSQQEGSGLLPARPQCRAELQGAAGIGIVIQAVVAFPVQHCLRPVKPVPSQELLPPARIAFHRRARQAEETLPPCRSVRIRIAEFIDLLQNEVVMEFRLRNELSILHVHQVLGIKTLRRQFGITEHSNLPRPVRQVLHRDPPHLMGRAHGNIVQDPAADPVILADNLRIARAMVTFGLVFFQRLRHRLPAGGPEVTRLLIPQIDIPARLIKLIEGIPQNPPGSTALDKAVSPGIHRYNRAVFRRSQIIGPGRRRIRIGNDILSRLFVKIAVLHDFSS